MTRPEAEAVRELRRWAVEVRADWALALLSTSKREGDLPPAVTEARDEATRALDALMEKLDAEGGT